MRIELEAAEWQVAAMSKIPSCIPYIGHLTDVIAARNEKREIYILTSFIEAHEVAQHKIVGFMGHSVTIPEDDEDDDEGYGAGLTPEEKTVLRESRELVYIRTLVEM